MTKRRHRRYDRSREYNNRGERRRGIRITVSVDRQDVFVGRMRGFVRWKEKNAELLRRKEA